MAIFPEDMLNKEAMTMESIATKLTYFNLQLRLLHWQADRYSEHKSLEIYEEIYDALDGIIEKLMGYWGKKIKAFKLLPLSDGLDSEKVIDELADYAYSLYEWSEDEHYCDIEESASELRGKAKQVKYLLSLK
jgi:hypothetical protein